MSTLAQRSFSGGEISPALYARNDQVKYATGLRSCRNFMVQRHGGAASRPGTSVVGEVKDSTTAVRLLKFVFNASQTYSLEFGHQYMRVVQNGGQVLEATKAISGISRSSPAIMVVVGHGYSSGDEIYVTGALGMTEINGRNLLITVLTADTFSLSTKDGNNLNSSGFSAYTSAGTVARVYTISTPYISTDLSALKFAESADVITITHPSYQTRELSRAGNTSWTLTALSLVPAIAQPDGATAVRGAGGALSTRYRVTAVAKKNGEESLPGFGPTGAITGATQASPCVITQVGHGYANGDEVYISTVVGMTQLNGNRYVIKNVAANTYELTDPITLANIDSTAFTAYSSAGTGQRTFIACYAAALGTSAAPCVITIPASADVSIFNIYKEVNGVYGFIGVAATVVGTTTFNDIGATPDMTDTPPNFVDPFPTSSDYPSCVGFFQQRRLFGNTNNDPEKIIGSKSGSFKNFTTSIPSRDDDSISFTLAGRQVNSIKHLVELGTLIAFTQAAEFSINGGPDGVLTPSAVNPKAHSYCGASDLAPIVVDATAIFVQARGGKVRDLAFDWQVSGYRGNDLSIFSTHLFEGFSLVDWDFAQIPNSIIWAVRSDGVLLGLTYVREQQVWGWHRHDTDGFVENVCCIPEGGEDAVYLVVRRTINGRSVRYIERMATRAIDDIVDFIGMDCSLSYDGRNTDSTKTMTLTGGTTWGYTENLTLTAVGSSPFLSTDVGNSVFLTASDGTLIRCTITAYTSATVVTVRPNKTVPVLLRGIAVSTWAKAIKTIGALFHLEGKNLSILGDGLVVASPNNSSNTIVTVSNGKAVLDKAYSVIHAGLPFISDLETLDPDSTQGETIADKKKLVGKLTMFVEKSRGIFAGARAPDPASTDTLDGLYELKIRGDQDENYDDPVALATGSVEIIVGPGWNNDGRVFVRQVDPVPLTVLAVMPAGYFPTARG